MDSANSAITHTPSASLSFALGSAMAGGISFVRCRTGGAFKGVIRINVFAESRRNVKNSKQARQHGLRCRPNPASLNFHDKFAELLPQSFAVGGCRKCRVPQRTSLQSLHGPPVVLKGNPGLHLHHIPQTLHQANPSSS
jgi:hypothetical protein